LELREGAVKMIPTAKVRVLTHTDMDGVCCAALFIRKYGKDIDITYATVKQAQQFDGSGISFDYVCDLPKVGNAINLDHHKSNYENLVDRKILWGLRATPLLVKSEFSGIWQILPNFPLIFVHWIWF
jgi:hypothetical protein